MNTTLPIIGSPSRTETASRCYRRHVAADVLCMKPNNRQEEALAGGTVVHAGAAEWWRGADAEKAIAAVRAEAKKNARWLVGAKKMTLPMMEGMMRGYMGQAQLTPLADINDGPWSDIEVPEPRPNKHAGKIVSIEQRVVLDLGHDARMAFQLDRLTEFDGRLVLTDTKTASRFDRNWESQWALSLQQKLYRIAIRRQLGRDVDAHFIEGVLKKLPTEVRYVALPNWTDGELDEALTQFRRICQKDAQLVAASMEVGGVINTEKFFRLALTETDYNPHDCHSYGVECPLYRVCTSPLEDRVGILRAEFEHVPPDYLD